jgi:hypothetical protein
MGRVLGLRQSGEDLNPQREQNPLFLAWFNPGIQWNNIFAAADKPDDIGCFWPRRMKHLFRYIWLQMSST